VNRLFVGIGASAVCWYRAALPAAALGADWVGVRGTPPELRFVTGDTGRVASVKDMHGYDVVVIQQPRGRGWLDLIRSLQAAGATVLYELDDMLDVVLDRDEVRAGELVMRICDGVICSTEFLARRYRSINPNTYICRNGLDLRRYELTRVPRETVTIGWSGASGHERAFAAWLPALREVMLACPRTRFMSVGQRFADELATELGSERAISIPFGPIESYPAAMSNFDIALAPAGRTNFFRAKSDLRWLEASALGIPVIADPDVYPSVEHGVTGFHAGTPQQAAELMLELAGDRALRERVGAAAQEIVRRTRSIQAVAGDWLEAVAAVAGTPLAA
jgi:glycosyltransferase involved in cell wall biosynthesis